MTPFICGNNYYVKIYEFVWVR